MSGVDNTIDRQGEGLYAVTLPGQLATGATVEVTAYGSNSDYCKVGGWSQSGGATVVNVLCFDTTGALSDSKFTLSFANAAAPNGASSYSHAWAHDATSSPYTPSLDYQRGFVGGSGEDVATDITIARPSTGSYIVEMPAMSPTGPNVQVTAYGSGSEYCKVVSWLGDAASTRARVACFDAGGAPANTRFLITYTDDKRVMP